MLFELDDHAFDVWFLRILNLVQLLSNNVLSVLRLTNALLEQLFSIFRRLFKLFLHQPNEDRLREVRASGLIFFTFVFLAFMPLIEIAIQLLRTNRSGSKIVFVVWILRVILE